MTKMKTLASLLMICLASGAALANVPVPSAPLNPDDVRVVTQAIAGAEPACKIESIEGYGLGDRARSATIQCEPAIDKVGRRASRELTCERDDEAWTCKARGTRVRYGAGRESVNLFIPIGITVSDGLRVLETCLEQQEFRAHYIKRAEGGFVAYAQEGMIVDADVVLGDKPSCLRRDSFFDLQAKP